MAKQKSLSERLQEKRDNLKRGNGSNNMIFFKEGKTRIRPVPIGKDNDWGFEIVYFYLGKEIQGYISPKTFGKKCAVYEAYEELKNSKKEDDRAFVKKSFSPKKRYLVLSVKYKDEKGTEIDKETGVRLALTSNGIYQDMLDEFLDEDGGDFTNPITGYDLKIQRTGSGQMDTEYKLIKCKPSKLPKEFRGPYDLEAEVKKLIPTYEESVILAKKFLDLGDDDSDNKPIKKKKKKKKSDL